MSTAAIRDLSETGVEGVLSVCRSGTLAEPTGRGRGVTGEDDGTGPGSPVRPRGGVGPCVGGGPLPLVRRGDWYSLVKGDVDFVRSCKSQYKLKFCLLGVS